MNKNLLKSTGLLVLLTGIGINARAQQSAETKAWVAKSNEYTKIIIDLDKKYSPEYGSSQGLAEYDSDIAVPTLQNIMAERKDEEAVVAKLTEALKTEKNTFIQQDINIIITHLKLGFRQQDFELSRQVPFLNASSTIYSGLETLLDDQTPEARREAAVMRIRKYAGLEKGYKPLTTIYRERLQHQMGGKNMIYPSKQRMETDLSRNASIVIGIAELCTKYKVTGWEQPYATLKKQLENYDKWVKANVLVKARTDFRLPPEEYAMNLEAYGIDIPPAKVAEMAHALFNQIQDEMKPIAGQIAKKRNLPSSDYRAVIRELKKEQIHGDSIIPLYEQHLKDIEGIIRDHQLVTLPNRPAIIRLATAAETAQSPAPHMVPPPFLNNTGQRGVFVLPLNMPASPGEKATDKYDDFTFDAASWTIIAHEARPGHELQFDKMVEEGVSQARALYAFNSTNVEGWGLYSEYITRPYMPLEGQLVSLDYRLLRAARAFLDPELQAGKITQQQALDVLMNDVVQSRAFARQEVERYTINAPGQANSYFYGFTKMIALRKDTEAALGNKFNALHFHDFILSQGILPPALIREAVMNDFVPKEKAL
ncbi:DUF885 domain-containing protein [Mucilaginibacter rubeus]|uniref:DUF885 domain-containing protein n=1 Tax=Mucilaginibacter rubeus TaxID=2027860 RepID=A0AAE6MJJ6_9SPHI|nr:MULTISPECIES: DUF885 domain-containing protein [Mucilaginibacter]QEM05317.1 DUF885 domain-containing protein [Mucilaginibacter rubeus]QEM17907.1 DUF885 domain-containing protein [Mucilaginibacter gossypii]QTE45560.1 DUF885 domain-containing protein [Mucilaginibacter rubeus]QTE52157.1 DUF885 domain-containing protein [Mucilaginibacter rubeus]QTE57245.1 DUF885 domain-containing protein [Mucilaginibacter rubeus]